MYGWTQLPTNTSETPSLLFGYPPPHHHHWTELLRITLTVSLPVLAGASKGWEGQEAWTEEYQEQRLQEEAEGGTTEEAGHEGWVWDDTSGWYYDEDLAAQVGGIDVLPGGATTTTADHGSASGDNDNSGRGSDDDSDSDDDSSSGSDGAVDAAGEEAAERKKQRRKRSLPPRSYPRSKAQRLVDEAEDSMIGARPEVLDLGGLGMDRVTSRVYRFDWLKRLDLSRNRLCRISPDLAGMESLVDVDLRHNRYRVMRITEGKGSSTDS